ncbi:MAG: hypothetical protein PHY31_04745, partial [Smithellaceae bacterium]|nr:hypothetical protein [Smithellaceae bacterium]
MIKKHVLWLAFSILLLAGCAAQLNVPVADIQAPPVNIRKQLPIKVAVELPPESTVYTRASGSGSVTIQSGRLVRKFAQNVFPELFDEVTFIDGKPYPDDVDAIVIPTIESFNFDGIQVALGFGMKFSAKITMKVTMLTAQGMRVWSHVVSATKESHDVVSPYIPVAELVGEASTLATAEAIQEAAQEIGFAKEVTDFVRGRKTPQVAATPAPQPAPPQISV